MNRPGSLLFGTAGIPLSTVPRDTLSGIRQVKQLGLGAMEVEFVHSINLSKEAAPLVKKEADGVVLTCHAPYYINLNAAEPAKRQASAQRILQSARVMASAGGWSVCFHPGFYMGGEKEKVYGTVKREVEHIAASLKGEGASIWIRPETTGKPSAFGDLDECIRLAQDVEGVQPCIDFAHLHARSGGKYNSEPEFREIMEKVEQGLGKEGLHNMHIHMTGIAYSEKGEKHHLVLEESDFRWQELLAVWKEFGIRGVVVSESPNIEHDALLLKTLWESGNK